MKQKKELIVYKSNELIQKFAMDLERTEWDLFDFMVAKIKSPKFDQDFNLIEFTIMDFFSEVYGKKRLGGEDYRTFKSAVDQLAKRQAWGVVKEGKYKNYETIMRLIDKPYLDPETGKVVLKLDDNLKPYLLDFVDKNYSKFLLVTKASLSSKYTKKLYELLKSNENLAFGMWPSGTNFLKIEDFKSLLNIPDAYIAGTIKRRILEPSKEEISEKTDISFTYREIKEGKKVVGYQFKINKQEKTEKITKQNKEENDQFIDVSTNELDEYGYSVDEIKEDRKENVDSTDYDRLRHTLSCLDNPSNEQLYEIYHLASDVIVPTITEGSNEWEWRLFDYLRKKNMQINAYPNAVKSAYGLLKTIIIADAIKIEEQD